MLHPTRGKLLVEVIEDPKLTQSGLILSFKEEIPHRGRILALGLPYTDKKGRESSWGMVRGHIVHFKRIWDQNKVKNYILKRDQIYAVEFGGKAYGFADYVIVRKSPEESQGLIFVPKHFESEVSKETAEAVVISVGKECRLGLQNGDRILYYKNEGLNVMLDGQDDIWSLKSRAIVGVMKYEFDSPYAVNPDDRSGT